MISIKFSKYHGTGNDFIIINNMKNRYSLSEEIISDLCDRHFSIGADGLIFVSKSDSSDLRMVYHNSDGSIAQMCGNGIRCFAKFAYDYGITDKRKFTVETLAGEKTVEIFTDDSGKAGEISVNMGKPIFTPSRIPVNTEKEIFIDEIMETPFGKVEISALSMGNPHVVVIVHDLDSCSIKELGSFIENSPVFPEKTNVNFVQIIDLETVRLITWERGSGLTLACGTGASAAAALLYRKGLTESKIKVNVPGGQLKLETGKTITMTGPAVHVFDGIINLTEVI